MTYEVFSVELPSQTIIRHECNSVQELAHKVGELIVRSDNGGPGACYIPDTIQYTGSIQKSRRLQRELSEILLSLLLQGTFGQFGPNTLPDDSSLIDPRFANAKPNLSFRYREQVEHELTIPHLDSPFVQFLSMLYGPAECVSGGAGGWFDIKTLAKIQGKNLKDYIEIKTSDELKRVDPEDGLWPETLNCWVNRQVSLDIYDKIVPPKSEQIAQAKSCFLHIPDFTYSKFPILFCSNRFEDGIYHHASRATFRWKNYNKHRRHMNWCALGFIPEEVYIGHEKQAKREMK